MTRVDRSNLGRLEYLLCLAVVMEAHPVDQARVVLGLALGSHVG